MLVKDLTLTQAQGVPTAPPAKGCGCAAGADGVLPLLGVLLAGLSRRRRRAQ
ncbi:MAG: MYXO-CTERM sorting domain-containing protein [Myxococcaceae bacterium]|nr:MYXO-CTERM sorting domain-containing protein [Myxococcaceae bacterium]